MVKLKFLLTALLKSDLNFQNQNLSSMLDFNALNLIKAGNHINTSISYGDVIIKNTANVKFRAGEEILLDEGFETEDGAEFLAFIEQFFTCTEFPLGKRSSISSTSLINQQKVEEFNSAQEKSIISFYPNPTQGVTNVNASFQNNGSFEIIILDASGQILKTEIFKLDESELKINFPLNFSIYSQGIYFIQIKTLNEIKTFKLIKI